MDCSTPILDGDTPEMKKRILVQAGGDALVRELRQTYADRLAGLFWNQQDGEDSRLVLRLTGEELVAQRQLTVCGEPLIVDFMAAQTHTRDELMKLHSDNLDWFRATFPGLVYQLGNLLASVNATMQASLATRHGNDYAFAMAVVAGTVAVVIAGLILFSRERRGVDMGAGSLPAAVRHA